MCGIAGTIGFGNEALLRPMIDTIAHRGPDGEALYVDDDVCLGNRRLAILDVPGGSQPMSNEDGSVVVVYNGEIYNYPQLREQVLRRGHRLTTTCDTELLPHLYEDEGIGFLSRLNGIFAFALFDRSQRKVFLVRDPLGVKPLVYAIKDQRLAFGSEAKAVLASGLVGAELDEASLHLSMNVRYVPGDHTFFAGIRRIPPGHVLEFTNGRSRLFGYASTDWTPDDTLTRADWLEGIRHHYQAAVKRQLLSDVPVGVSLSGGIDSSSIVAMLRHSDTGPIKTFSLGFDEPTDELDDARFVARLFETDHHEIVLREPALDYLGEAIRHTEEPKVNSLQLYLLHRFIGEHVTVVLSGLGGDELFAGYDFYRYLGRSRRLQSGTAAGAVRAVAPMLDWTARRVAAIGRPQLDLATRKLEWLASAGDGARHYLLLRNAWDFNSELLRRVYAPEFVDRLSTSTRDSYGEYFPGVRPLVAESMHAEFATKMVSDLLHNEDTMSMAHGVESRVPLLDLELVRFAARIPDRFRFGTGPKGLLKEALRGSVLPDRVLDKKKWGFTFDPVEQYKKDLGSLARELLTPERLRRSGIFNPDFVRSVVSAAPHQRLRWHYFLLWQMIGVELWRETFAGGVRAPTQSAARPAVEVRGGSSRGRSAGG
jgi:asparagine synthase (glutamine-hydrolysing)